MRRIIALLLAIVMLTGTVPAGAFAQELCAAEGCTYDAGHEGNCSNYVAPTEPCGTEGCTFGSGHEGNCSNFVAPTEPCGTEGCTFGSGHEGNCSNFVAPSADEAAAKAVEELILAIGEVSLQSEAAILQARTAYDALSDIQKQLVGNLAALEEAESSYAVLTAEPETVPVTGITLDRQLLRISLGSDPVTLTATVSPENATDAVPVWQVSNPSIATVVGGTVTAVSEGTAFVTVTAGEYRTGCIVEVLPQEDHTPAAVSSEVVEISTAAELAAIDDSSDSASKSYILTADITASGTLSTRAFKGTLDGNGHTVTVNGSPLFGTLNGTVTNLILKGTVSASAYTNTGALCKSISSGAVIRNCMLDVEVTHTGTDNTTHACGIGYFSSSSTTVSNCLVLSDITTSGATASLIGGGYSVGTVKNTIGVGSSNFISKSTFIDISPWETISEQIPDTNIKITGTFDPEAYVSQMNANCTEGDLTWRVKDGVLGPWGAAEPEVTPAAPISMVITIANQGELVLARQTVTVSDYDSDGRLNVDDALYAAHAAHYETGADGYANKDTDYGLSIQKLWGLADTDKDYGYGYWLNDASCWSLEDPVEAGDYLVAFVYKDAGWSDAYARFESAAYEATAGEPLTVGVKKARYDADLNTTVFEDFSGASITANTEACTVDGYSITFQEAGTYQIYAACADPILVPAVAEVTVKASEKEPNGIYSQADFSKLATAGTYMLMNNITLDSNWTPVNIPAGTVLDGQGYVITLADKHFAGTVGGTIQNLGVTGALTFSAIVGSIAAKLDGGSLLNSWSTVNITTAANTDAGGLIGEMKNGSVKNCYYAGTVTLGTMSWFGGITCYGSYGVNTVSNSCHTAGAAKVYGNASQFAATNVASKSADDMKSAAVITLLNSNIEATGYIWTQDTGSCNNGYPVLKEGRVEVTVDKTALAAKIEEVKTLVSADYTASSWEALQTALSSAESTNSKEDATQTEVNNALSALESAVDRLEKKKILEPVAMPEDESKIVHIATQAQLDAIGSGDSSKFYVLDNDITLSNHWNFATFQSVLDGQGHTVTFDGNYTGMFNNIGAGGVVQNVHFAGSLTGDQGPCGTEILGCVINCSSEISGNSASGFAKRLNGGAISNCYSISTAKGGVILKEAVSGVLHNVYWETGLTQPVDLTKVTVTGNTCAKAAAEMKAPEFLALLNAGRGSYGKQWNCSSSGYPWFGENQNYETEESVEITFTSYTGEVTKFQSSEGLTVCQGDWDTSDANYGGYLTLEGATGWDDGEANLIYSTNKLYFTNTIAVYPITVSYGEGKSASFTITVSEPKDALALRLIAGETTLYSGDTLTVQGNEEIIFRAEARYEENGTWQAVSSGLLTYSVTGTAYSNGAVFHATEPGSVTLRAAGLNQTIVITVTSEYVPVTSVSPGISGTIELHGRNANSTGGASFLPTLAGVNVVPAHASYADDFTVTSSDAAVGEYIASMANGFVPYKAGTVTYTASIDDRGSMVSGSQTVTYVYKNPLKSVTAENAQLTLELGQEVSAGLTFTGTLTNGHEITETGMVWSFDREGIVEISRGGGSWKRDETAPDNNMYFLSPEYTVKALAEGTVTVTGTPVDTTGGAQSITLTVTVSGGELTPADNDKLVSDGISGAQRYIQKETYAYNDEWRIFSLIRSGAAVTDAQRLAYVNSVKNEVGTLTKPTDIARVALALRSLGENPADIAGVNLLARLYSSENIANTSNEAVFALIALDMDGYSVPDGALWTRDKLIDEILSYQTPGGGFGLTDNETAGIDMTAMAMQALAPYSGNHPAVKAALDKALAYLKAEIGTNGSFGDANKDAQVLVALAAMNVDILDESTGFAKNVATNLITGISSYRDAETGGFTFGGIVNSMTTCQSLYGLESYRRFRDEESKLYDLTDIPLNQQPEYSITEGQNSQWSDGSGSLTIKSDVSFSKFTGVRMDGQTVEQGNYTAVSGSTVVTFKPAYLKTLSVGAHTVTLVFTDGEAETLLTIALSDQKKADAVIALINGIGTVTRESRAAIENARSAYDALTQAQKDLVTNYAVLTNAEARLKELLGTVTVYAEVRGCYVHNSDDDGIIHNGQTTWASGSVTATAGSTVYAVLSRLSGIAISNTGNYISAVSNGSITLAEMTNGVYSGWKYSLNGSEPSLGVDQQTVSHGDSIVLYYTDNYTGVSPASAAKRVEALINAIGTVTLDSEAKIKAARNAYDGLTAAQKAKVSNYKVLEEAEKTLSKLKINHVETLIRRIGNVTLSSADQIAAARRAYDALTSEEQRSVSNRSLLTSAEIAYDNLRVEEVEAAIEKIPDSVTKDSEQAIRKARQLYDALTDAQKKLVKAGLLEKLLQAERQLALDNATQEDRDKALQVVELIEKLGTVTPDSLEAVTAARKAYDSLTPLQKTLVTNYQTLLDAEAQLALLTRLETFAQIYRCTGNYLEGLGIPCVGSVGGEWMVIGLSRSGRNVSDRYYENVLSFTEENIDANQRLHSVKSTENSRVILALTALGKDVTDVGGHNLLLGLNDLDYICKQGINGPIYALLALDSGNYPAPEDITRQALVDTILDGRLGDGGWALSGTESQPDMTAMALQALAPYTGSNADVMNAVQSALQALSGMQRDDGTFSDADGVSSESLAQVIIALSALGIDGDTDPRFVKNGISVLDALLSYAVDGGGFCHLPQGGLDGMATEQAYCALAAYDRMIHNKTSLYNMTDVLNRGGDETAAETTEATDPAAAEEPVPEAKKERSNAVIWFCVMGGCAVISLLLLLNRRKIFGKYL